MDRKMKNLNGYKLVCLFLLSCFYLLAVAGNTTSAEEKKVFNKDINYDIYYEVTEHRIDVVMNVRILDTVKIDDITFLHITGSEFSSKEKDGYILFSTIRAILPSGVIKPNQPIVIQKEN